MTEKEIDSGTSRSVSEKTLGNLFRPNESWGRWFSHNWKGIPFIGDLSNPPYYQRLKDVFYNSRDPWIFASFANEFAPISLTPPKSSDEFFSQMAPRGFYDVNDFMIADVSEKWGMISYSADCFIVGAEEEYIEKLIQLFGGSANVKARFEEDMAKLAGFSFGAGAIINKLPELLTGGHDAA